MRSGVFITGTDEDMPLDLGCLYAACMERWLQMPVLRMPYAAESAVNAWQQEAGLLSPLVDALLSGIRSKAFGT